MVDHKIISKWRSKKYNQLIKFCTLLVAVNFLMPQVMWAFDTANYAVNQSQTMSIKYFGKVLSVPGELGKIKHGYQGKGRTVICIQDLHCNYEVQKNIAGIIQHLEKKYKVSLVGVEGAFSQIKTDHIRSFPVQKIKAEISDIYVKKGKLTGAEYIAITGKEAISLEGIETRKLYDDSLSLVQSFLTSENQGYIYDLRDVLNEIKIDIYNQALLKYDAVYLSYREGRLDVLKYIAHSFKTAKTLGLDTSVYSLISKFLKINQLHFSHEINADQLLKEVEHLDNMIREGFYTSKEQRQVDDLYERLDIIEKLLNISVLPEELESYRQNQEAYGIKNFVDFINTHQTASLLELDMEIYVIEEDLKKVACFYELADKRSTHFVGNLLAKMDEKDQKIALLINGGFHAGKVLDELRQKDITYVSIIPSLTRQDIVNPYFELLENRQTPLEKLLEKNQNILALKLRLTNHKFLAQLELMFKSLGLSLELNQSQQAQFKQYLFWNQLVDVAVLSEQEAEAAELDQLDGIQGFKTSVINPATGEKVVVIVAKRGLISEKLSRKNGTMEHEIIVSKTVNMYSSIKQVTNVAKAANSTERKMTARMNRLFNMIGNIVATTWINSLRFEVEKVRNYFRDPRNVMAALAGTALASAFVIGNPVLIGSVLITIAMMAAGSNNPLQPVLAANLWSVAATMTQLTGKELPVYLAEGRKKASVKVGEEKKGLRKKLETPALSDSKVIYLKILKVLKKTLNVGILSTFYIVQYNLFAAAIVGAIAIIGLWLLNNYADVEEPFSAKEIKKIVAKVQLKGFSKRQLAEKIAEAKSIAALVDWLKAEGFIDRLPETEKERERLVDLLKDLTYLLSSEFEQIIDTDIISGDEGDYPHLRIELASGEYNLYGMNHNIYYVLYHLLRLVRYHKQKKHNLFFEQNMKIGRNFGYEMQDVELCNDHFKNFTRRQKVDVTPVEWAEFVLVLAALTERFVSTVAWIINTSPIYAALAMLVSIPVTALGLFLSGKMIEKIISKPFGVKIELSKEIVRYYMLFVPGRLFIWCRSLIAFRSNVRKRRNAEVVTKLSGSKKSMEDMLRMNVCFQLPNGLSVDESNYITGNYDSSTIRSALMTKYLLERKKVNRRFNEEKVFAVTGPYHTAEIAWLLKNPSEVDRILKRHVDQDFDLNISPFNFDWLDMSQFGVNEMADVTSLESKSAFDDKSLSILSETLERFYQYPKWVTEKIIAYWYEFRIKHIAHLGGTMSWLEAWMLPVVQSVYKRLTGKEITTVEASRKYARFLAGAQEVIPLILVYMVYAAISNDWALAAIPKSAVMGIFVVYSLPQIGWFQGGLFKALHNIRGISQVSNTTMAARSQVAQGLAIVNTIALLGMITILQFIALSPAFVAVILLAFWLGSHYMVNYITTMESIRPEGLLEFLGVDTQTPNVSLLKGQGPVGNFFYKLIYGNKSLEEAILGEKFAWTKEENLVIQAGTTYSFTREIMGEAKNDITRDLTSDDTCIKVTIPANMFEKVKKQRTNFIDNRVIKAGLENAVREYRQSVIEEMNEVALEAAVTYGIDNPDKIRPQSGRQLNTDVNATRLAIKAHYQANTGQEWALFPTQIGAICQAIMNQALQKDIWSGADFTRALEDIFGRGFANRDVKWLAHAVIELDDNQLAALDPLVKNWLLSTQASLKAAQGNEQQLLAVVRDIQMQLVNAEGAMNLTMREAEQPDLNEKNDTMQMLWGDQTAADSKTAYKNMISGLLDQVKNDAGSRGVLKFLESIINKSTLTAKETAMMKDLMAQLQPATDQAAMAALGQDALGYQVSAMVTDVEKVKIGDLVHLQPQLSHVLIQSGQPVTPENLAAQTAIVLPCNSVLPEFYEISAKLRKEFDRTIGAPLQAVPLFANRLKNQDGLVQTFAKYKQAVETRNEKAINRYQRALERSAICIIQSAGKQADTTPENYVNALLALNRMFAEASKVFGKKLDVIGTFIISDKERIIIKVPLAMKTGGRMQLAVRFQQAIVKGKGQFELAPDFQRKINRRRSAQFSFDGSA
ncbi:hypothetical protein KAR34_03405 [bacterium]|nr:hypothetical protein [bacterium]